MREETCLEIAQMSKRFGIVQDGCSCRQRPLLILQRGALVLGVVPGHGFYHVTERECCHVQGHEGKEKDRIGLWGSGSESTLCVRSDSHSGVQLVMSSPYRFKIGVGAEASLLLVQSGSHVDGGADD